MKITAPDLQELGLIDGVIAEPEGGGHNDHQKTAALFREALLTHLEALQKKTADELVEERYQKFRNYGQWTEQEEKK